MKFFAVVLLGGSLLALEVSAQTQDNKVPARGEASASGATARGGGVATAGSGVSATESAEAAAGGATATAVAVGAMTAKWIAAAVGKEAPRK